MFAYYQISYKMCMIVARSAKQPAIKLLVTSALLVGDAVGVASSHRIKLGMLLNTPTHWQNPFENETPVIKPPSG